MFYSPRLSENTWKSSPDSADKITKFILLPEKFLQFDWLRAEVFQLNLKYLHVKITVTMTEFLRLKYKQIIA